METILTICLTILTICLVIFVIGILIVLYGALREDKRGIKIAANGAVMAVVSGLLMFVIDMVVDIPEPPKYFPESEYSLEYIVTECGGKIDTTYVLIPKEK